MDIETKGPSQGAKRIRLELPDGKIVELERDGFEGRGVGNAVWRGRVAGNPDSRAVFTVKGKRLAGRMTIGTDIYEVRPYRGQSHIVEKLDMSSFPLDADALVPDNIADLLQDEPSVSADLPLPAADGEAVIIDLMSVYTPQARDEAGGTEEIELLIQAAVDNSNAAFIDSSMNVRFRLVYSGLVSHDDANDLHEDLFWVTTDGTVAALRDQYGADMVSLIVQDGANYCGIGYVQRNVGSSFAPYAFQVTDSECAVGNLTLAHEHGHNMGMEHDPTNGPAPADASYLWSFAHFIDGSYRTVMSYSNQCTDYNCPRAGYFSNPDISFLGDPTGITDQRDNARTGDLTAPVIAAYRDTTIPQSSSGIVNIHTVSQKDDAEELHSNGWTHRYDVRLELGEDIYNIDPDSYLQSVGLRFQNIMIPQGATILSAYLELEAYETSTDAITSVVIRAEASDNASEFLYETYNITARPTTTASVPWSDIPAWTVDEKYQTPDLSALVQEVVNRSGWSQYNSMVFVIEGIEGVRIAKSYDFINDSIPKETSPTRPLLHIEYATCSESTTLANNQWVTFAPACDPGQNSVADLFSGLNVNDYNTSWVVYERDAANNTYIKKTTGSLLEGGKGYWFYTEGEEFPLFLNGRNNLNGAIPLEGDPAGRWNLVGHPHTVDIPWNDVRVIDGESTLTLEQADPTIMSRAMQQWDESVFLVYDGITPGMEGTLTPFAAMWVEVFKPGVALSIPAIPITGDTVLNDLEISADELPASIPGNASQERNLSNSAPVNNGDPWYVRLIVDSGDLRDAGNVLGQLADSVDGLDSHDLKEKAPFGSTYLSIVFPHEEWNSESWGYTSDYRALTKKPKGIWPFVVKASNNVTDAVLRWEGPDFILKKARLVDGQTGRT